ncbi:MAG: hypothetical protein QME12_09160 [Nanoarchaeota archaeon]|nr:hypothetical protein [Nanoarchaeota archaeon]
MAALSFFTDVLLKWVINPLFWLLIIMGFVLGTALVLWVRKKRRLKYPGVEIVDLGQGRIAFNFCKTGWFGDKIYLNMLWWSGNEVMRIDSGQKILEFSTEDYQEVNGQRGVVFYRSPTDQDILVPINKVHYKNKELVAEIAPAAYRDAATDMFNDSCKETTDFKEKLIQFAAWALVVIFSLVAIIVIVQYVKHGQDKAADMMMQAGEKGIAYCKDLCGTIANSMRGSAP